MKPVPDLAVSAVILAGGASRRMGRDKAWIEFRGRPLIQLAAEKIRALGIRELFISGRMDGDYSSLNAPVLFDRESDFGPLAGMEQALHQCRNPLLLVLAVDLPLMDLAMLQKLLARCDRLTGAVPKLRGRFEPLAAVYPKRCHAFAFAAIANGCHPVCDFVAACLQERAVRPFPVPESAAGCFANWNHPADVAVSG